MVDAVYHSTEEGKKVERNAGKKFLYAARRKRDEEMIQSVLDCSVCCEKKTKAWSLKADGECFDSSKA